MDETLKKACELLAICAYRAFSNVLSGSNSDKQQEYFDSHKEAKVGDMALESSGCTRAKGNAEILFRSIGRIISINHTQNGQSFKLELLDGSHIEWTNASFIKIPEDFFSKR